MSTVRDVRLQELHGAKVVWNVGKVSSDYSCRDTSQGVAHKFVLAYALWYSLLCPIGKVVQAKAENDLSAASRAHTADPTPV